MAVVINNSKWMNKCRKLTFREEGITLFRKQCICFNFFNYYFFTTFECSCSVKTLMNMPVKLEANQESKVW